MMVCTFQLLFAAILLIQIRGSPTNSASGAIQTESATLSAPKAISVPQLHSAKHHANVTFECLVGGSPTPVIHWKKGGRNEYLRSNDEDRVQIQGSAGTLTISRAKTSDSGVYSCLATNSLGSIQIDFSLEVQGKAAHNTPVEVELTYTQKCLSSPNVASRRCADPPTLRSRRHVWVYSQYTKKCIRRHLKDCSTMYNKYNTQVECENTCVMDTCQLPRDQGPCFNYVSKMYYNPRSGDCEKFAYGGCGGNENNFRDISACRSQCAPHLVQSPPAPLNCPFCSRHLAKAYCNSNFVIAGKVKRITPRYSGTSYRGVRIEVTQVFKDESNLLGGKHINISNPLSLEREFELDVDRRCPCPNLRSMARGGSHPDLSEGPIRCSYEGQARHGSTKSSRNRRCRELIISGQNRYGILTITQGSLAEVAEEKYVTRMQSNVNYRNLCQLMRMVSEMNG